MAGLAPRRAELEFRFGARLDFDEMAHGTHRFAPRADLARRQPPTLLQDLHRQSGDAFDARRRTFSALKFRYPSPSVPGLEPALLRRWKSASPLASSRPTRLLFGDCVRRVVVDLTVVAGHRTVGIQDWRRGWRCSAGRRFCHDLFLCGQDD